mmetsp:Transcript_26546/g.36518  ORF Transcript_26546/g.36518 Transcript_26546/m.36518 type:complete len:110 (-) Transcript_26546:208-537(-)
MHATSESKNREEAGVMLVLITSRISERLKKLSSIAIRHRIPKKQLKKVTIQFVTQTYCCSACYRTVEETNNIRVTDFDTFCRREFLIITIENFSNKAVHTHKLHSRNIV